MNIFVIPSWYPSKDYPLNGIMIYEQTKAFCTMYPDVRVGISIWGQKEEQYLLWSKDHVKNLLKIATADFNTYTKPILPNLKEYHKPAFTWSNKIAKGNMSSIVKANLFNLRAFETEYGKADLIHAQVNHPAGRIAMEVARAANIPYCITERMSPFPCIYSSDKNRRLKKAWQISYANSSANITISRAQAALMKQQGIRNIKVIPNFIDEDYFKPALQPVKQAPFAFLTLTSAVSRKGIDILLQAIQLFNSAHPSSEVVFKIGGIGDISPYKTLAKTLSIEANISWLEQANREEARKEFQSCNAFVLASLEESFGNVYAEAIACGKPVIATKCGGPESIVNEINGLLVEKNDAAGLAKAMDILVSNYDRYDSTLIRQDFLSRFSSKVVLPHLYQFYQEMIKKHTSSPCK